MSDFFGTGLNQSPRNFELGEAAYWDLDQLKQIILVDTNVDLSDIRQSVTNLDNATLKKSANLNGLTDKSKARNNLGLGDAATKNVGENAGNVMQVGAGGWLLRASPNSYISGYPQSYNESISQIYRRESGEQGVPSYAASFHFAAVDTWGRLRVAYEHPAAWIQGGSSSLGTGWTSQIILSDNLHQGTGQSTTTPMSQKAVTDALNTKADKKYVDDSAFGVGQTWQDMTPVRAAGTIYTNNSGRTIVVSVIAIQGGDSRVTLLVDEKLIFAQRDTYAGATPQSSAVAIVPPWSTYRAIVEAGGSPNAILHWMELR